MPQLKKMCSEFLKENGLLFAIFKGSLLRLYAEVLKYSWSILILEIYLLSLTTKNEIIRNTACDLSVEKFILVSNKRTGFASKMP